MPLNTRHASLEETLPHNPRKQTERYTKSRSQLKNMWLNYITIDTKLLSSKW